MSKKQKKSFKKGKSDTSQQVTEARKERNQALGERNQALKERDAAIKKAEDLRKELEQVKIEFQRQQARIIKAGFSASKVIAPLARELEMFDIIAWMTNEQDDNSIVPDAVYAEFAKLTANLDAQGAADMRRSLVTRWVYLRWWELTNETGE